MEEMRSGWKEGLDYLDRSVKLISISNILHGRSFHSKCLSQSVPSIQRENLFRWLSHLHTYIQPIKRPFYKSSSPSTSSPTPKNPLRSSSRPPRPPYPGGLLILSINRLSGRSWLSVRRFAPSFQCQLS